MSTQRRLRAAAREGDRRRSAPAPSPRSPAATSSCRCPRATPTGGKIPDGGTLPLSQTSPSVDLDQLFNTLDDETVASFKKVIKGFATSYEGIGPQANAGFEYLNPFLSTSRRVFAELTSDERRFDRLIVDGASLSDALAERSDDIEQFVSNTNPMMGAIASENVALAATVGKLPDFMRNFNTTAVNLRAALDDLDPLVSASIPVALKLQPFMPPCAASRSTPCRPSAGSTRPSAGPGTTTT